MKETRDCTSFALLRSVIGLENSRHHLDQSDAKLKPITTWLLAFSSLLGPFTCIYFEFSLAPYDSFLCPDWPLFSFYHTQSKSVLCSHVNLPGSHSCPPGVGRAWHLHVTLKSLTADAQTASTAEEKQVTRDT